MNFFPSQSFEIHADISALEAWDSLSKVIVKNQKLFSFSFSENFGDVSFNGYINQSKFNIRRNLFYRNSFQAEISGEIFAEDRGCRIAIELNLMPFVKGFVVFWCSFAALLCVIFLCGAIGQRSENLLLCSLIPLGMIGFCYLITSLGFKSDCDDCRKALNTIFKVTL